MTGLRTGPWSDREVRHLRKLERRRTPFAEIAETLGRTIRSVESKLKRERVPPAPRPLGSPLPREEMTDRRKVIAANVWHLVDLKRAGHSPRQTELCVGSDGGLRAGTRNPPLSSVGSPAALCAEV